MKEPENHNVDSLLMDLLYEETNGESIDPKLRKELTEKYGDELAAYREIRAAYRGLEEEDPAPQISAKILREAGKVAEATAATPSLIDRLLAFVRMPTLGLAGAAAVALLAVGVGLYATSRDDLAPPTGAAEDRAFEADMEASPRARTVSVDAVALAEKNKGEAPATSLPEITGSMLNAGVEGAIAGIPGGSAAPAGAAATPDDAPAALRKADSFDGEIAAGGEGDSRGLKGDKIALGLGESDEDRAEIARFADDSKKKPSRDGTLKPGDRRDPISGLDMGGDGAAGGGKKADEHLAAKDDAKAADKTAAAEEERASKRIATIVPKEEAPKAVKGSAAHAAAEPAAPPPPPVLVPSPAPAATPPPIYMAKDGYRSSGDSSGSYGYAGSGGAPATAAARGPAPAKAPPADAVARTDTKGGAKMVAGKTAPGGSSPAAGPGASTPAVGSRVSVAPSTPAAPMATTEAKPPSYDIGKGKAALAEAKKMHGKRTYGPAATKAVEARHALPPTDPAYAEATRIAVESYVASNRCSDALPMADGRSALMDLVGDCFAKVGDPAGLAAASSAYERAAKSGSKTAPGKRIKVDDRRRSLERVADEASADSPSKSKAKKAPAKPSPKSAPAAVDEAAH